MRREAPESPLVTGPHWLPRRDPLSQPSLPSRFSGSVGCLLCLLCGNHWCGPEPWVWASASQGHLEALTSELRLHLTWATWEESCRVTHGPLSSLQSMESFLICRKSLHTQTLFSIGLGGVCCCCCCCF